MKKVTVSLSGIGIVTVVLLALAAPAQAGFPKDPISSCADDAVVAGAVCMDKYEASVWRIPATNLAGQSNAGLIKKVRKGTATALDLAAGNATQRGTASDDYAPCLDNAQNCKDDIYALSLAGVTPSRYISWFQANVACENSAKQLPSNADWQVAVTGSPDPGADNGTTDCNTNSATSMVAPTGSRSGCVSAFGAFDMVGNLDEWVADWVPRSTSGGGWGAFSNDLMGLSGASTTALGPGALLRGGDFDYGSLAGPLSVVGQVQPSLPGDEAIGFRCAR